MMELPRGYVFASDVAKRLGVRTDYITGGGQCGRLKPSEIPVVHVGNIGGYGQKAVPEDFVSRLEKLIAADLGLVSAVRVAARIRSL